MLELDTRAAFPDFFWGVLDDMSYRLPGLLNQSTDVVRYASVPLSHFIREDTCDAVARIAQGFTSGYGIFRELAGRRMHDTVRNRLGLVENGWSVLRDIPGLAGIPRGCASEVDAAISSGVLYSFYARQEPNLRLAEVETLGLVIGRQALRGIAIMRSCQHGFIREYARRMEAALTGTSPIIPTLWHLARAPRHYFSVAVGAPERDFVHDEEPWSEIAQSAARELDRRRRVLVNAASAPNINVATGPSHTAASPPMPREDLVRSVADSISSEALARSAADSMLTQALADGGLLTPQQTGVFIDALMGGESIISRASVLASRVLAQQSLAQEPPKEATKHPEAGKVVRSTLRTVYGQKVGLIRQEDGTVAIRKIPDSEK